MSIPTFYAGPAKVNIAGVPVFGEGSAGEISLDITQEADAIETASHGYVGSSLGGAMGKLRFTPFEYWGVLPTLFPTWLGVTTVTGTGAGAGALAIGTKLEANYGAPTPSATTGIVVINPVDAWSILMKRAGLSRPPDLHLGVGKKPFGQAEVDLLPSLTNILSSPPVFFTAAATGATDISNGLKLGATAAASSFQQEQWTGTLGSALSSVSVEDEWTITPEVKWATSKASKQPMFMYLTSARFMAKGRIFGYSADLIQAAITAGSGIPGALLGYPGTQGSNQDLVLTGVTSGKTVTLKNVDVVGAGFKFGASQLGGGEIGFVTQAIFSSGALQPQLLFSA